MIHLHRLDSSKENNSFPAVENALTEPNGLLAMGGTLSPRRLIDAYRHGIFPWYNEGQPILWWAPDPRFVLYPERLKVSRSLRKTLRKRLYRVTLDMDFRGVIAGCAAPRAQTSTTWISHNMRHAYTTLYELGVSHSVETWLGEELVGGLYGIALGHIFYGESMFSLRPDASKVGFVHLIHQLQHWGFAVVDCQIYSNYLKSFGAEFISRREFIKLLTCHTSLPGPSVPWRFDPAIVTLAES